MPSNKFIILTIIACGIVTWLSRIVPFILLKKFNLSKKVLEILSFVPITIMSALWFESLFIQHLGHLPQINYPNLIASIPTVIAAIITKNLLITVAIGVITLGIINILM